MFLQSFRSVAWVRRLLAAVICIIAVTGAMIASSSVAQSTHVVGSRAVGGNAFMVDVYSSSMGRNIPLWIKKAGPGAPNLYLLNGVDGGDNGQGWPWRTDVNRFFAGKHVNVISPIGGHHSYYTDWNVDDPAMGRQKWQTFLTRELPPVLNNYLGSSGRNAIAGVSMSANSVLDLAIHAPGLYKSVGSYSGCARTSDPFAQAYVFSQVGGGGGNAINMWGSPGGPQWIDHDPTVQAGRLRGMNLFISAGTGAPGVHEGIEANNGDIAAAADRVLMGGALETVVNQCTTMLAQRMGALGIPAHFEFRPQGTHSWPWWEDDLKKHWPAMGRAIGAH